MIQCKHCRGACVRTGVRNNIQLYRCKSCKKYQRSVYRNLACNTGTNKSIVKLLIEGVSIRGIARVLRISMTTVIERIKRIAKSINKSYSYVKNRICEIDELWTFVGSKRNEVWITYSIDRGTKEVIHFHGGERTKEKIQQVTNKVLAMEPRRVCTDGLTVYKSLIPKALNRIGLPNTRHIERFNLNLRTHLKRLSRKTICFSKSKEMLEACLKIYFWGDGFHLQ